MSLAQIQDPHRLSRLLDALLQTLENSAFQVSLQRLSYDTHIPECVLERLRNLHRATEPASDIEPKDFHVILPHILFRYPTVRVFELPDGSFFFET